MAAKRKLEYDVSEISELGEKPSVTVHGALLDMSPIKTSKRNTDVKYMEGRLTDGLDVLRFVSFSPAKIKGKLDEVLENADQNADQAISLVNCAIKKSKIGSGFELVLSDKSTVSRLPKKFKVDADIMKSVNTAVCAELKELSEMDGVAAQVGNKVTVVGKVVSIKPMDEIKSGKGQVFKKQECILADRSKACRFVIWDHLIDKLENGKSYRISNVSVKAYNGSKYLSSVDGSETVEVSDVGDVIDNTIIKQNDHVVGEIVAIVSYSSFSGCISCGAKVAILGSGQIGGCEKCALKQKITKCKKNVAARVILEDQDGKKRTVSMFNEIVRLLECEVVDEDDIEPNMKLLMIGLKKFQINSHNNTVIKVENID